MSAEHKPHLKIVKPSTEAQKITRTTLDTIIVTPKQVQTWKLPSFQRPLKVNHKVMLISAEIAETQVIPGTLTLGILKGDLYLIDGQHRREAFVLANIPEGIVDVRYAHFDSEAEMGDEFVKLNSHIVSLKPDDILRGLEKSNPELATIRKECPYVGYDQVRRNERAPIISMSALLRCWFGSAPEVPTTGGLTAARLIEVLTKEEVQTLVGFCDLAMTAWGKDKEYARLWSSLNMTVCMWLYRRLVITPYSANVKKITREMFQKCLMSVGSDASYTDWLLGKNLRERDRSPCYHRVKSIFAKRIEAETGEKPRLPSPAWSGGK